MPENRQETGDNGRLAQIGKNTQWKKGCPSPNPGGRPRKKPLSERYEACLEEPLPEALCRKHKLKEGATYGDAIALGQAKAALEGRTDAAREIANRVEGRVTEQLEVAGAALVEVIIRHIGRRRSN